MWLEIACGHRCNLSKISQVELNWPHALEIEHAVDGFAFSTGLPRALNPKP